MSQNQDFLHQDTRGAKARNFFLNNIGFLIVIAGFVAYVGRIFLSVGLTGKTLAEILTDGLFSLFFGWIIKNSLSQQGIIKGLQSEALKKTQNLHGQAILAIKDYRTQLNDFCDMKTIEYRIKLRTDILSQKGLEYGEVFCDDNTILDKVIAKKLMDKRRHLEAIEQASVKKRKDFDKYLDKKLRKEQREISKCIKKAWAVRITPLTAAALASDSSKTNDPFYFGQTIKTYSAKTGGAKLGFALATMIIFGFLKAGIGEFDVAKLIWSIIQMFTFIVSGLWSLSKAYMFITDTYRKGLVRKIDYLEEFETACKSGIKFVIPNEIIHIPHTTEIKTEIKSTETPAEIHAEKVVDENINEEIKQVGSLYLSYSGTNE